MKRILFAAAFLLAALATPNPISAQTPSNSSGSASKDEKKADASSQPVRWEIKPGAELSKKGRLVVDWPDQVPMGHQRLEVHSADGAEKLDAGKRKVELLPGSYDVIVRGKRVSGVPIEEGKETHLLVGLLRVVYTDMSTTEVYDSDKKTLLVKDYGTLNLGLPVGKYWVKIGPRFVEVEIKAGQVVEF